MSMLRFPGEVYELPKDAHKGGDPKPRRHVLLTSSEDDGDLCTFAYGSTKPTEAQHGASNHLVDPGARGRVNSGFVEPTYVYPARLVCIAAGDLEEQVGRLVDDMIFIKNALRTALGLGTGTAVGKGPAAGSIRGQFVQLKDQPAADLLTRYALAVTEPGYSWTRRNQLLIPIYDSDDLEPDDSDLHAEGVSWLEPIGLRGKTALISISQVQTFWHRGEIESMLGVVADDATMLAIDNALENRFTL